jgi:hypothetical protein
MCKVSCSSGRSEDVQIFGATLNGGVRGLISVVRHRRRRVVLDAPGTVRDRGAIVPSTVGSSRGSQQRRRGSDHPNADQVEARRQNDRRPQRCRSARGSPARRNAARAGRDGVVARAARPGPSENEWPRSPRPFEARRSDARDSRRDPDLVEEGTRSDPGVQGGSERLHPEAADGREASRDFAKTAPSPSRERSTVPRRSTSLKTEPGS